MPRHRLQSNFDMHFPKFQDTSNNLCLRKQVLFPYSSRIHVTCDHKTELKCLKLMVYGGQTALIIDL